MVAVVVEVDQQRAAAEVENVDAGLGRLVECGSVRLANEQAVRQPTGLQNVDVVEVVTVHIADDDPLCAEQISDEAFVRARPPVVKAARQLCFVALEAGEHQRRSIDECHAPGRPRRGDSVIADGDRLHARVRIGCPLAVPGRRDLRPTFLWITAAELEQKLDRCDITLDHHVHYLELGAPVGSASEGCR